MNLGSQLKSYMAKFDIDLAQAAEMCGVDIDSAMLAVKASSHESVNLGEMIEKCKPRVVQVLMEIVDDSEAEDKDRIAAGKILLQGEGVLPNSLNMHKYAEGIARMKAAASLDNIIDITPRNKESLALVAS